jgi:DNA-directed RNA polymerase specialized sigma24 family protein
MQLYRAIRAWRVFLAVVHDVMPIAQIPTCGGCGKSGLCRVSELPNRPRPNTLFKKFDNPLRDLLSSASLLIVETEQAPDPKCSPVRLLASYIHEFERWMESSVRCRKSAEPEDIRQEIRLAFWELRDTPATPQEARRIFQKLASRFATRSKRQVFRQGALVHDTDEFAEKIGKITEQSERHVLHSLALFDALEHLDDEQRWLIIECKFKERSNVEVGKELGVSDDVIRYRLWRAMTELLAILKEKDETTNGKKKEHGIVIAPLMFKFTNDQCGAFWSIWSAEGRLPTYGGPPGPPPKPPGLFRWIPSFSLPNMPTYIAAIGGTVGGVGGVGAFLFCMLGSPNETPKTARFGVQDHFRIEGFGNTNLAANSIPTVVDSIVLTNEIVPVHSKDVATSSSSAAQSSHSSPPIDPDEIKKAKHRAPRFLPSRQK